MHSVVKALDMSKHQSYDSHARVSISRF